MKKLTGILIAAALILAPMSVSALEMMTDSNMKDVTGQAGVSIAVDDIVLYQESLATTTYWDTDGLTTHSTGSGGAINDASTSDARTGVQISYDNNAKRLITIDAVGSANRHFTIYSTTALASTFDDIGEFDTATPAIGLNFDGTSLANDPEDIDPLTGQMEGFQTGLAPLSIDVGTAHSLTSLVNYNSANATADYTMAGVIIGLPTLEITQYHTDNVRTISIVSDAGTQPVNAGDNFIEIEKSGSSRMTVLGGTVEIAPH